MGGPPDPRGSPWGRSARNIHAQCGRKPGGPAADREARFPTELAYNDRKKFSRFCCEVLLRALKAATTPFASEPQDKEAEAGVNRLVALPCSGKVTTNTSVEAVATQFNGLLACP